MKFIPSSLVVRIYSGGFLFHLGVSISLGILGGYRESLRLHRSTELSLTGRYLLTMRDISYYLLVYTAKGIVHGTIIGLMWPVTIGPALYVIIFDK